MALQKAGDTQGECRLAAVSMPPPAPLGRKQVVLDEDEYTEKLEAIIERDFFPDLPKMQNKLEWLQAVNSGDPTAIRNAQMNIAARRAGIPTPLGATPAQFATPAATPAGGGGSMNPTGGLGGGKGGRATAAGLMTPGSFRPASALRTPVHSSGTVDSTVDLLGAAAAAVTDGGAPPVSLNAFLKNHTSEDNASFSEMMEEGKKRAREKNAWLYEDKNKPLMLRSAHEEPKLAIEEGPSRGQVETDGFGTGNAPDGALLSWKHISKNQLYYYKDGAAFSTSEKMERAGMGLKTIRHHNTRMNSESSSSTGIFSPENPGAATPKSTPGRAEQVGGLRGYSAVATPSMTPGADGMSPLMTWGDIDSTPLRIDSEDPAEAVGPSFWVPDVPSRDLLARRLATSTPSANKHRLASSRGASPLSALRRGSGTPLLSGRPSTKRTGTPLSSAAKRLVSQMRGSVSSIGGGGGGTPGRGLVDLGLRASYKQTGVIGKATSTPKAATSLAPKQPRTPSARPPKGAEMPNKRLGEPAPQEAPPCAGSLTDGLLNI